MSVKDVKNYYEEVANQYSEMMNELKDFSELAKQNLYSPEKLEEIEKNIQPLKRNYEVLSYIMYLLNKPTKNCKEKNYEYRNKKLLSLIDKKNTKDGIISENNAVIKKLRDDNSQ